MAVAVEVRVAVAVWLGPALGVIEPHAFTEAATRMTRHDPGVIVVSGILAGWLMGLLSWLVSASRDTISQVAIVGIITTVIGLVGLHHVMVAAAEVLKVGSGTRGETKDDTGEAREGLMAVILGTAASAGLAIVSATRVAAAGVAGFVGLTTRVATGYDIAFSLALFGAGHLVGLSVGVAMLVGLLIAWAAGVPILTYLQPVPDGVALAEHAERIWRQQVICIEKRDQPAGCPFQSRVARRSRAAVLLAQADDRIAVLPHHFQCAVGRAIVDDENLSRRVSLTEDALQRFGNVCLGVVHGHDDANSR